MKRYTLEEIQKMTQAQFQDVLVENTDANYHTENVLYIAYRLGNKELIERAGNVLFRHHFVGELDAGTRKERDEVLKELKKSFLPCHQQTIWECL
jgi:predicted RecB family nuclease